VNPGGTNPALSTPMSPPLGRPETASSVACPSGANAYTRPLVSFGATRSPPNWPNPDGATVRYGSLGGMLGWLA